MAKFCEPFIIKMLRTVFQTTENLAMYDSKSVLAHFRAALRNCTRSKKSDGNSFFIHNGWYNFTRLCTHTHSRKAQTNLWHTTLGFIAIVWLADRRCTHINVCTLLYNVSHRRIYILRYESMWKISTKLSSCSRFTLLFDSEIRSIIATGNKYDMYHSCMWQQWNAVFECCIYLSARRITQGGVRPKNRLLAEQSKCYDGATRFSAIHPISYHPYNYIPFSVSQIHAYLKPYVSSVIPPWNSGTKKSRKKGKQTNLCE